MVPVFIWAKLLVPLVGLFRPGAHLPIPRGQVAGASEDISWAQVCPLQVDLPGFASWPCVTLGHLLCEPRFLSHGEGWDSAHLPGLLGAQVSLALGRV